MVLADTPTVGLLVGLPIGILITLACLAIAVFCLWPANTSDLLPSDLLPFGIGALICALAAAIITAVAMWPWRYDYHHWVDKGGVVEKVAKRLVPAGDSGMQEKIVLVIDGQPYGVLDTRAALVRKGDRVRIACKKAFQWGSDDHGWDCRWNGGG